MNLRILAQLDQLTPQQRALREHFQRGGSWVSALLIVGILALVVYVTYWLSQRVGSDEATARRMDPQKLFHDLLEKASLGPEQKKVLGKVVTDLAVEHPAVLLLSLDEFDRCMEEWISTKAGKNEARVRVGRRTLEQARRVLYPEA